MDDFIRSVNNVSNINKGKTDGTIWMTKGKTDGIMETSLGV